MSRLGRTSLLALAFVAGLNACERAPEAKPAANAVQVLDSRASALRDQFNRDAGKVRLLFILDPACPTCLRGLADLDQDVLRSLPASVPVYAVHVPVIGGNPSYIPGAAGLVHARNIRHYWNPSGSIGKQFGEQLSLTRKGKPVFAWDVWMIYGPEARWTDRAPQPRLLMHQLPSIDAAPKVSRLDSNVFARALGEILQQKARVHS